tara:strand:- start:313 stop:1611 length:1299 start_codon:yes stop_codon:yes gene_type:complete
MSSNLKIVDREKELNIDIENLIAKKYELYMSKFNLLDLSHLKTYTIDDVDTIEIDDAISLEKINAQYKLWIHIASPAVYLDYGSSIDKSAKKRISSLYLSQKNIYMFPEKLIKDLFSISKKEKRVALSLGVIFNCDGTISSYEIVKSLINPNYQLSYEDADELIEYAPKLEEDLSIISNILDKIKSQRKKQGAIEIIEPYGKVKVIEGIPCIKVIDQSVSRQLVSEAMILYGNLISIYTREHNIPVPYRVQEGRTNLINNKKITSQNKIFCNYKLKQSMGKTYYSLSPLRHNGLGLNSYLHATSPIRRYADLIVHYQINKYLNNIELISKDEIDNIICEVNNKSKQNINRFREDQKIWINKWFENSYSAEYKVIFLNWINRYKNICIIYFIDYCFSLICLLNSNTDIKIGKKINIKNITVNYKDMLCFQINS